MSTDIKYSRHHKILTHASLGILAYSEHLNVCAFVDSQYQKILTHVSRRIFGYSEHLSVQVFFDTETCGYSDDVLSVSLSSDACESACFLLLRESECLRIFRYSEHLCTQIKYSVHQKILIREYLDA